MKQFVLKDGEEPGIYPGLGLAEAGKPLTAYSEDQEKAFADDKRFKIYHAPKEDEASASEAESTVQKPAKTGKDGK
ncbi:hypothetical protein [Deinococcus humi]|uniref:Uncharacterized protein n=1 Tax=Deinococcus humi TaxID=662880 RepID=A0A7W8JVG3_9DEIO|nr:hypothetical protein [Deinococcus humi]MBB5363997.1 hypothetical protein [Deinococcus humi]GGO32715.1 hypothetical protein GCM10008949_30700 [Deinococcus humi]